MPLGRRYTSMTLREYSKPMVRLICSRCRSLGTAPGSTAYVYCREATASNRQAADEAQRQAWAGVAQAGFQMMATPPPAPQPPPSNDHVCIAANNTYYRCP